MKRRDFIRLTGMGILPGLGLSGKRVQQETESVRPQVKTWLNELRNMGVL